jgi:Lipase
MAARLGCGWIAGGPFYQSAVENVAAVGYQTARMLDFMERNAGPMRNLHLIGNNLGAHAMGVAASLTNVVRVPRITGERCNFIATLLQKAETKEHLCVFLLNSEFISSDIIYGQV